MARTTVAGRKGFPAGLGQGRAERAKPFRRKGLRGGRRDGGFTIEGGRDRIGLYVCVEGVMGRARLVTLLAAAGLAVSAPALAMIPPSYRLVVAAPDSETEAVSRALLEAISSLDAFFWQSSDIGRSEARACLRADDPVRCVHELVSSRPVDPRARPVVVIARPAGEGKAVWTCLGSGANKSAPAAVPVEIDLRAALFGDVEARTAERRKAIRCVYAAETESLEN